MSSPSSTTTPLETQETLEVPAMPPPSAPPPLLLPPPPPPPPLPPPPPVSAKATRTAHSESERIRRAVKSAAAFNSMLQKEKRDERRSFFDMQTMRIQKPVKRACETATGETSSPNGLYPVALIQGQYQNYYKRYTSDELRHMPLDTLLANPPASAHTLYDEWRRSESLAAKSQRADTNTNTPTSTTATTASLPTASSDISTIIKTTTTHHVLAEKSNFMSSSTLNMDSKCNANRVSKIISVAAAASQSPASHLSAIKITTAASSPRLLATAPATATSTTAVSTPKTCCICQTPNASTAEQQQQQQQQQMVTCSSCARSSHPECLELNPALVEWSCVRSYEWQCMECKTCSECANPHDEDRMMFCDRCDRGFHTYCVGVDDVPSGSWMCRACSSATPTGATTAAARRLSTSTAAAAAAAANSPTKSQVHGHARPRGRPPGSLNKPKDPNSPVKLMKKPFY